MATEFLQVKNRATSTTAGAINDSDDPVTFSLAAGEGSKFPATAGGHFNVTIENEILHCTSRSTDTLTCARAQEGTTIAAHAQGSGVFLNITAKHISDLNTAVNTLENGVNHVTAGDSTITVTPSGDSVALAVHTGIDDDHIPAIDDASVADNDYCRFTATGIEGLTRAETMTDLLSVALPEDAVIQLDAALASDEHWSGISMLGEMGYSATVGDIIYLNSSGHWELAKADAAATASGPLGMCLATTNEDSSCQVLLYGKIRSATLPSLTVGAPVYLDYTNGGDVIVTMPAKSTNRVVRIVGYGITAEDMLFAPEATYLEYA